ncbi:MAG: hypothetical protein HQ500_05680 [Flavobacteriales bacterium]|nr:hypothetical protein [Flavobacteriales bacterium]
MKVLQEVFGKVDAPAISAADILHKTEKEQSDVKLQDDFGAEISLRDIELGMNGVARSLISLGVICGDRIAIYGLSYSDSLLLYLAAEQIGINVIHLSGDRSITDQVNEMKPRLTITSKNSEVIKAASFGEFLITKEVEFAGSGNVLAWDAFLSLERFASDWELEKFRVISA